jgi:hypothetical protein
MAVDLRRAVDVLVARNGTKSEFFNSHAIYQQLRSKIMIIVRISPLDEVWNDAGHVLPNSIGFPSRAGSFAATRFC